MNTPPQQLSKTNKRWWDWFAAILLVLAIFTAVLRLLETKWSGELSLVQVVALSGVILGLALGQSIFTARLSFGLSMAYGMFIVLWQLGLSSPKSLSWQSQLIHIGERVNMVVSQVNNGEQITDSIIFIIFMALLFWVLSVSAGYTLMRHGAIWWAILPTGMVMFVIHFYHNCPYTEGGNLCNGPNLLLGATYLGSFWLLSLLLLGRVTYMRRLKEWNIKRIFVAPEVGFDLTRFAIAMALAVLLLAWFAPVAYAKSIPIANKVWIAAGTPVRKLNDKLKPLFESVRSAVEVQTDDFGTELSLGRGGELSDRVTMQVEVKGSTIPSLPFYWRNRVYDEYSQGNWQTTITETKRLVNDALSLNSNITGGETRFIFTSQRALSVLYVPSRSVRYSPTVDVELEYYPDGTIDPTAVRSATVLRPSQSYQVVGKTFPVTIKQLKEAGDEYPTWITERYLQLPDEITPRTRELANQLAIGAETPYDIVAAVTTYLRTNLEYSDTIPAPPEGQEPIDWVLFDYGAAFCNYYASAEIVLLRSLGIPARLVVGYAQGQRQANPNENLPPPEAGISALSSAPGIYLVRARDAHAWPEVYFPGIGWVEFEPTTSRTAIERPSGDSTINLVPPNLNDIRRDEPIPDDPTPEPFKGWDAIPKRNNIWDSWWARWVLPALAGVTVLALVAWHGVILVKLESLIRQLDREPPAWLRRWAERIRKQKPWIARFEAWLLSRGVHPPNFIRRWANWSMLSQIQRAYAEVNKALTRLGYPPEIEDTPTERLTLLAELLPQAAESCRRLLTEYQAEIYSQHTAHPAIARWAADRIQKQSIKARLHQAFRLKREAPQDQAASA
jgi:transglutaminase-like putative cysteine protease